MWKLTLKGVGYWEGIFEFETIGEAAAFLDVAMSHSTEKLSAKIEKVESEDTQA